MSSAASLSLASTSLLVAPRFCGPPGAGNGGYVAGRLAARTGLRGVVEVTLRRPTPLGVPLRVCAPRAAAEPWILAAANGEPIAEARAVAGAPADAPPALPAADVAPGPPLAGADHPFPGCFVCGPARPPGDGLRLLPAAAADGRLAIAPWTPAAELAGPGGFVDPAFVWAALDCPGYFGATLGGPRVPLLLGRMTAAIRGPVRAGARLRVLGWRLAHEGRRHEAATALVDEAGRIVARARQVWLAPRA